MGVRIIVISFRNTAKNKQKTERPSVSWKKRIPRISLRGRRFAYFSTSDDWSIVGFLFFRNAGDPAETRVRAVQEVAIRYLAYYCTVQTGYTMQWEGAPRGGGMEWRGIGLYVKNAGVCRRPSKELLRGETGRRIY